MKSPQGLVVHLSTCIGHIDREIPLKLPHLHLGHAFLLIEIPLVLEHLMNVREVHIYGLDGISELTEAQLGVGVGVKSSDNGIDACLGRLLLLSTGFGIILKEEQQGFPVKVVEALDVHDLEGGHC